MLKARIREWLVDHPKFVNAAFVVALAAATYNLGELILSGGSAYEGP